MAYKNYEDQKASWRKHYANNKEYYYKRNIRRKEETRQWLASLKENTPCSICNSIYPQTAMDWHHRNPKEKSFTIAASINCGYGKEKILKEVEKCDLVCAVCHRILEFES
jgi:hypothetical protein